jgi:hypothetical protein
MSISFEYTVDVIENGECVESVLEIEASVSLGSRDYFCSSFGNYLPGDPDEVEIDSIYYNGEEVTLAQAVELSGEKNLLERLEQEAFDQAA